MTDHDLFFEDFKPISKKLTRKINKINKLGDFIGLEVRHDEHIFIGHRWYYFTMKNTKDFEIYCDDDDQDIDNVLNRLTILLTTEPKHLLIFSNLKQICKRVFEEP